jgi:hypothetical protein
LNTNRKTRVATFSNHATVCTAEWKVCINQWNSCRNGRAESRLALNETEQTEHPRPPRKSPSALTYLAGNRTKTHRTAHFFTPISRPCPPHAPPCPLRSHEEDGYSRGVPTQFPRPSPANARVFFASSFASPFAFFASPRSRYETNPIPPQPPPPPSLPLSCFPSPPRYNHPSLWA